MKTIEEIKKFFPNHKFEDDFDLKLIQFTAEDLIDFSEEYAKKVASLEKKEINYSDKKLIKIIELARDNAGFDYYNGIDWIYKEEEIVKIIK